MSKTMTIDDAIFSLYNVPMRDAMIITKRLYSAPEKVLKYYYYDSENLNKAFLDADDCLKLAEAFRVIGEKLQGDV